MSISDIWDHLQRVTSLSESLDSAKGWHLLTLRPEYASILKFDVGTYTAGWATFLSSIILARTPRSSTAIALPSLLFTKWLNKILILHNMSIQGLLARGRPWRERLHSLWFVSHREVVRSHKHGIFLIPWISHFSEGCTSIRKYDELTMSSWVSYMSTLTFEAQHPDSCQVSCCSQDAGH